jgi:ferredoxin-NADP reductase
MISSRRILSAGRTFTQRLMLDRQVDFWLSEVRPVWSLRDRRARVVAIVDETHDVKTFVLAPRALFASAPAAKAGQYVPVDVEIDGRRVRRFYSIASAPGERHLRITVKRAGRVSSWMHDRVRVGDVLRVGAPAGTFVLPETAPPELLFVVGGSGITPAMAILRQLATRGEICDVVFVVCSRTSADRIFAGELAALAAAHPGLRLVFRDDDRDGLLDGDILRTLLPDLEERVAYVCGPDAMMAAIAPLWRSPRLAQRLRVERFVTARARFPEGEPQSRATVRLTMAGRSVDAAGSGTLLEQLERAGERPAHGCRMGICNTCRCRKTSGVTEDITTGALSSGDEEIRLCVSIARSDLDLGL